MNDIISFSEVYDILQHLNTKLYEKIPQSFIEFIDENRNKEYKVNIDYTKSINSQKLQKNTRIILSLIYRDYLCTNEQKEQLIDSDKIELQKQREILNNQLNLDKIFHKRSDLTEMPKEEKVSMIVYKKSLFHKIINKISKILKL